MINTQLDKLPWFRQPFVWMLIAPPAFALIGGLTMLIISLIIDDGVVVDDYYKKGKEINKVLVRDEKAHMLGMRGHVTYSPDSKQIVLDLGSNKGVQLPDNIEFLLMHATRGGMDTSVDIKADAQGVYRFKLTEKLALGGWVIHVGNDEWRIQGRMHIPSSYKINLSAQF